MNTAELRFGTAAWAVPTALKSVVGGEGSHLERYSRMLNCVEINTSFYRDHKASTYEKWAQATPPHFRFAVKLSRVFTHDDQLVVDAVQLRSVVEGIMNLGEKLGVILVQLPPKLAFHELNVRTFFRQLRAIYQGPLVIEPRHKTWVSPTALKVLEEFEVGKVIADPEPCPADAEFQRTNLDICYIRWHGAPVVYESRYELDRLLELKAMAQKYAKTFRSIWIVFDNTTYGWATVNALEMQNLWNDKPLLQEEASQFEA